MATQTERYIRSDCQWVKVTRDPKARTFTLARGWNSSVKAHDVTTWPMRYVPTWADAEAMARQKIADHA